MAQRVGNKVKPEDVASVSPADEEFIRQQHERAKPCETCKGGGKVIKDFSYIGNVEGVGEPCPDCLGSGWQGWKEHDARIVEREDDLKRKERDLAVTERDVLKKRDILDVRQDSINRAEEQVKRGLAEIEGMARTKAQNDRAFDARQKNLDEFSEGLSKHEYALDVRRDALEVAKGLYARAVMTACFVAAGLGSLLGAAAAIYFNH